MRTDFTKAATSNHEAKQDTRQRPLDIVRKHSAHLWSRKHQALRFNWIELPGHHAPTLQMLLDAGALQGPGHFGGVDTSSKVLQGCREHYGDDVPAFWVKGNLITALRSPDAFPDAGVLVYDSFRAAKGAKTIEKELPVLARYAHRQEQRLGEFLLVLNVAIDRRFVTEADQAAYRGLIADTFPGLQVHEGSFHTYQSKKTAMLWAAIRLGF